MKEASDSSTKSSIALYNRSSEKNEDIEKEVSEIDIIGGASEDEIRAEYVDNIVSESNADEKNEDADCENVEVHSKHSTTQTYIVQELDSTTSQDIKYIKFVAEALDMNSSKQYMKVIRIDRKEEGIIYAVGTDGRRLHYAKINVDVPEGNYFIFFDSRKNLLLTACSQDEQEYPDWRKAIDYNYGGPVALLDFSGVSAAKGINKIEKISIQYYKMTRRINKFINIKYFQDIGKGIIRVYVNKKSKAPIRFEIFPYGDVYAYILPIALDNDDED